VEEETLNVQPAYAESFGVASAHLSRRSEAKEERPTPNVQLKFKPRSDSFESSPAFQRWVETETPFLFPKSRQGRQKSHLFRP
jgi:hypothetical protein